MVKGVNGVEFAFRWCPPGTFTMGSPESEAGRQGKEVQHQVTLTKGFWIMETEVTQKQWQAVMGANPSHFKGDDLPIENVSWNECQEFCRKTGFQFPTEAQWEYACRAGTTGMYAGNLDEMTWYDRNGEGKTHPVSTKTPNAWGLYDMHGNVWEWCQDWEGDYPDNSVTDPSGPSNGIHRTHRGGSWAHKNEWCRSAHRSGRAPDGRDIYIGFRCIVLDPGSIASIAATTPSESSADSSKEEHKAGDRDVVTINGVEFAFRWCPPGTFMMGSPESEAGRENNEMQHQVTLTKGFWMMETEVTQKQWQAVMGYNPSRLKSDGRPVESVSWNNCQDFCRKTGLHLPTEAQWEYACRAGTTGPYAGNLNEMAWYGGKGRHTVRSKKPNAWGLYDMHGNVWEWCQDKYGSYPKESVTDPIDTSSVAWRVRRSGGGSLSASKCRSASRGGREPSCHNNYTGFRCIKY